MAKARVRVKQFNIFNVWFRPYRRSGLLGIDQYITPARVYQVGPKSVLSPRRFDNAVDVRSMG
jgi:hypothetical protein